MISFRDKDYFNTRDFYLIYDTSTRTFITSQLIIHRGSWYSKHGLKYKMSSVKCMKCNELI